eukprot:c39135_g1_i1.p1 GENE.c39135_g1_i1~~c39135_g1_i1.p1  ORF type:complete len:455 (-),score=57.66 c39135_g1_i1:102-1466(-)
MGLVRATLIVFLLLEGTLSQINQGVARQSLHATQAYGFAGPQMLDPRQQFNSPARAPMTMPINDLQSQYIAWQSAIGNTPPTQPDLNRVNDTYSELFMDTMCPAKRLLLDRMEAVERIIAKIPTIKSLTDTLEKYPIFAYRLFRHQTLPTNLLLDSISDTKHEPSFQALYATAGYQNITANNPQKEFTFYVTPDNRLVDDPQKSFVTAAHRQSIASFLELEASTSSLGVLKIIFCGFFGVLLLTWLFVGIGYWIYFECIAWTDETEAARGCFAIDDKFMKYRPWWDIIVKIIHEFDTDWPPRKSWIESFVDQIPDLVGLVKMMQEKAAGNSAASGGNSPPPSGGDSPLAKAGVDIGPIQDLQNMDEEELKSLLKMVPMAINEALAADERIPVTEEQKMEKAEIGWRKESQEHTAIRYGLSSAQSSSMPSYSPFGVLKYGVRTLMLLLLCDILLP